MCVGGFNSHISTVSLRDVESINPKNYFEYLS